jgi:NifU-like protein involved in Fe-S cluster formation
MDRVEMSKLSTEELEELRRLKEKLKQYKEKLKELDRLQKVEQSIMVGLKEEGFSDKALDFFRYRRNFLLEGDPLAKNAETTGGFTGKCGDHIDTYLRIDQDHGIIEDAKYRTDGCPGAVTSASALTELAKGTNLEEALQLNVGDIVKSLEDGTGGLPKHMLDCCAMAVGSFREAIKRYNEKS